jgi:hypothetical protein
MDSQSGNFSHVSRTYGSFALQVRASLLTRVRQIRHNTTPTSKFLQRTSDVEVQKHVTFSFMLTRLNTSLDVDGMLAEPPASDLLAYRAPDPADLSTSQLQSSSRKHSQ